MTSLNNQELIERLDPQTVESATHRLNSYTANELTEWANRSIVTQELGSQSFRMLVAPGEDKETVLFAGGELGNGILALGALARARTIRDIVAPQATIIYQPNSTLTEDNMNFSTVERSKLSRGNTQPLVDRVKKTLDYFSDINELTLYGPSQGGTTALAVAAENSVPPAATAILEVPNVVQRTTATLSKDFMKSGKQLTDTIGANFESDASLRTTLLNELNPRTLPGFALGLLRPDNRSLVGVMRTDIAESQIQHIVLKQGSVVHAWGSIDTVSPADSNEIIATRLGSYERYEAYSLEGDHSITNAYVLNAALVHRARLLMNS